MKELNKQLAESIAVFRTCRIKNLDSKYVYSSDFSVMMTIFNAKADISAIEISRELGFSKVYASKVIKHLMKTEMIVKTQNEEDRRQYFLYLTEKGKDTCITYIRQYTEVTDHLCDLLGEDKAKEFVKLLDDSAKVLSEYKK